jgi:hypothetical protein
LPGNIRREIEKQHAVKTSAYTSPFVVVIAPIFENGFLGADNLKRRGSNVQGKDEEMPGTSEL